jgi:type IV pilus assembly protein PilW
MKNVRANSSQRGFTLIELMIALLIGVFLMAGVIQIFLSAKQAYRLQENLSRLQENGRFAMDILTKDIRMAGYAGCLSNISPVSIIDPKNPNPNPAVIPAISTGVAGGDNVTNNWNSIACGTSPANQCVANTDVISFQSATSCGGQLTGNLVPDNANLQINPPCTATLTTNCNTCAIQQYDILLVANCAHAEVFVTNNISNGSKQTLAITNAQNIQTKLTNAYGNDAELFAAKFASYYIRTGAGGVPSLYRIDNTKAASGSTNPVELVEGIENMQILYGVDTDANPDYVANYYVTAPNIPTTIATNNKTGTPINPAPSGWTRVVSVRINLLAVTVDNNLTDEPQPYTYNGTTVTKANLSATGTKAISVVTTDTSQLCPPAGTNCQLVDDRRIHRVFSSTIAVRNRLP